MLSLPLPLIVCCVLVTGLVASVPVAADVVTEVRSLLDRNDAQGALRAANSALALRPRDPQTRFMQGVALMALERDGEALAAFTAFSQEFPELPEPYNNLALLHARAGRLEQARQALETALRNDPGHRAARANLGEVHLMLAVQAWEQAAASGPLDPPLMRKLDASRALLAGSVAQAR